jgi:hypothetical protein
MLDGRDLEKTLISGVRWPDVTRNWAHSVLFVADHITKICYCLDPANENFWNYQTKCISEYFEKVERVTWTAEIKKCPGQKFAGDCNLVTLMIMEHILEGNNVPSGFSRKDIRNFKDKVIVQMKNSLN